MFKLYFLLFYEFAKIGVFAIGGGYAAIPFLFYIRQKYNWFSIDELTDMIAVSNITPGPVGINMATYTGFKTAGLTGSIISTVSILLIPFILTVLITKIFTKFQNNTIVKDIFIGLKPAACALLTFIGIGLFSSAVFVKNNSSIFIIDYKQLILFMLLLLPLSFFKKNPLLTIVLGALGGIVLNISI